MTLGSKGEGPPMLKPSLKGDLITALFVITSKPKPAGLLVYLNEVDRDLEDRIH